MKKIENKRIAILSADGFEQSELFRPKDAIEKAGGTATVISLKSGKIKSWKDGDWGESIDVDQTLSEAKPEDFDGLVLPGGVINPDILRNNEEAMSFVKAFFEQRKDEPVAAICHGPWLLIEAGQTKGLRATSYSSIKTDMENAGALWLDQDVVVDQGIITSRNPDDLDAFCEAIINEVQSAGASQ